MDTRRPAQPAQEPVAWPIETNNQIEVLAKQCGWDNRRYMTPADYQIWCDRMRQFVQLASPPAAQPAQEPVNQTLFGYEIFGCFFRDFDGALNAFKNQGLTWATPDGPFNGMNEDWIKKNIREVYVHGTSELERLNNIGNGGSINTQAD
jgi:hypothetical protein